MEKNIGAVAQIKKNAESSSAAKRILKDALKPEGTKKTAVAKEPKDSAPRMTKADEYTAAATKLSFEEAAKIAPYTSCMVYNEDQDRWQKAYFIHGGKDSIQLILCRNLFLIDKKRFGKGIIAPGKEIASEKTVELNLTLIRKAFIDHPDYRTLPVWKDQFKDIISAVLKK